MAALQTKTTDNKTVTVVIPTYNRPGLAEKLVRQIRSLHKNLFEILVIQSNGNTSVAKNAGIKKARGDIIIFFDDDVEITKETIASHIKTYEDPKIVGVAGRVINDDDKIPKDTEVETGKTNFLGTKFEYKFWSTKKQQVDFVYGCNMSFRRNALRKIKGFDEQFPKIFEEVDLSKRIKKLGTIFFEPKALVYHHKAVRGGIRHEEKQNKQKLIFENYGRYLAKNISFPLSALSLLIRTKTALSDSFSTALHLWKGFIRFFFTVSTVIISLLFCLAIVSRFWKLGEFFTFNFDEEYQALLAWEQVKNFHPIWIGVSASGVNYFLGPAFTYLNALLFYVNKDPVILAFFGSSFSLITTASLYYVTKNIWSQKAAIFAISFYIGSLFINLFDRRFWNPTPVPVITIWLIYSLYKLQKSGKWLIVVSFLMGLALHIHLSLLAFWPVIFLVFIYNFRRVRFSHYLLSLISFLLITFPLFIFDLNHNFDNMLMPFRYGRKILFEQSPNNIAGSLSQLANSLSRLWFIGPFSNIQDEIQLGIHGKITNTFPTLTVLSLIILGWLVYSSFKNGNYRILTLTMISFLLVYIFYPGGVVAYFLLGFFVLFSINVGLFLSKLSSVSAVLLIGVFMIANFYSLHTLEQEQFGLLTRKRLIEKIMPYVGNQSFYLETRTRDKRKYHSAGGWRYLFKAYGKTPDQSHADDFFGWIYQDEIAQVKPSLRVIIAEYPVMIEGPIIVEYSEGVFYGYVIKNE